MTGSGQRLCHPGNSASWDRASPSPCLPYLLAAHIGDEGTQGHVSGFDLPWHRDHPLQRLLVEGSLLVLEVLALKVVDLQEQSEGAVDELRYTFHLGGKKQQAGEVRVGSPSCLAASGKTLCFPMAMDFQYWLVNMRLGTGDVGMAGGEPAGVDWLGLHRGCCVGMAKHWDMALKRLCVMSASASVAWVPLLCQRKAATGKGVVFG